MKTWTVYIRRNKVNNKVYVGITVKTKDMNAGITRRQAKNE